MKSKMHNDQVVMELKIDETKNIAYIKITGSVISKDILNAFDMAVSDKKYKKGMGRLWDFTDVDLSSIDSETVKEMAQYSLSFPPGINDVKVAFVTSRPLEYGLSRMFKMSSLAKTPIDVFDTLAEAEKWLIDEEKS
jgi:hypothetical protein